MSMILFCRSLRSVHQTGHLKSLFKRNLYQYCYQNRKINMQAYDTFPTDLPVPQDDGACNHLPGTDLLDVTLTATNGTAVNLKDIKGLLVIYCYPRTGVPGKALPEGWNEIPGARGCTPQSCSFKNHYDELKVYGASVYGLSTQNTEYQQEVKARLHLPFELLSDEKFELQKALKLPVFTVEGMTLIKRITMIFKDGKLVKYFYPIFPPDRNAGDVLDYLKANYTS